MWCKLEAHPFFQSTHSAKCGFFYFISSNHPDAKSAVLHGIDQLCSRKQHRQHLPSLLYKSFFYMVGGLGLLMVYSSGLTNVSVCLDDDM